MSTKSTCPCCSGIKVSGTYDPRAKKNPKKYRVKQGSLILGDFDDLFMAQSAACGITGAKILRRKSKPKPKKSVTPYTDSVVVIVKGCELVPANCARKLECQLATANAELEEKREMLVRNNAFIRLLRGSYTQRNL